MQIDLPEAPSVDPDALDQRVRLSGVSWAQYDLLLGIRGEHAVPRMTYYRGELELMSPSRHHERIKTLLGRLVETYSEELGLDLRGYGSWTLKREVEEAGAEPDECYSLGEAGEVPDLVVEVVWTRGGLDKLEVYRALGVREVWVWEGGTIAVHLLGEGGYAPAGRSALLPAFDLDLLARLATSQSQLEAVRALRATLKPKP